MCQASPVRVVFGCVAAYGHFNPLLPLGRAFADAGPGRRVRDVASFAARVEEVGFELIPGTSSRGPSPRSIGDPRRRLSGGAAGAPQE